MKHKEPSFRTAIKSTFLKHKTNISFKYSTKNKTFMTKTLDT
jgi:hypothetical protein